MPGVAEDCCADAFVMKSFVSDGFVDSLYGFAARIACFYFGLDYYLTDSNYKYSGKFESPSYIGRTAKVLMEFSQNAAEFHGMSGRDRSKYSGKYFKELEQKFARLQKVMSSHAPKTAVGTIVPDVEPFGELRAAIDRIEKIVEGNLPGARIDPSAQEEMELRKEINVLLSNVKLYDLGLRGSGELISEYDEQTLAKIFVRIKRRVTSAIDKGSLKATSTMQFTVDDREYTFSMKDKYGELPEVDAAYKDRDGKRYEVNLHIVNRDDYIVTAASVLNLRNYSDESTVVFVALRGFFKFVGLERIFDLVKENEKKAEEAAKEDKARQVRKALDEI